MSEAPTSAFVVDVEGFEGPLDLLLDMARKQKVDLSKISMLALAEQFAHFVHEAHAHDIELSGEYLVMAAWLTYLKSQLLLPIAPECEDEMSAHDMAEVVRYRLLRLEAMRALSSKLDELHRVGRDVFCAKSYSPTPIDQSVRVQYQAELYDLLSVYANMRTSTLRENVRFHVREVVTLEEARLILEKYLGTVARDWVPLDIILASVPYQGDKRRSSRASLFCASLELTRLGACDLRQSGAFAPIEMRPHTSG